VHVEALVSALTADAPVVVDEVGEIALICYRVLEANHDPRAATVLETAQRVLQEYAAQIPNTALRRSFLDNVATHRELLRADTGAAAVALPSPSA